MHRIFCTFLIYAFFAYNVFATSLVYNVSLLVDRNLTELNDNSKKVEENSTEVEGHLTEVERYSTNVRNYSTEAEGHLTEVGEKRIVIPMLITVIIKEDCALQPSRQLPLLTTPTTECEYLNSSRLASNQQIVVSGIAPRNGGQFTVDLFYPLGDYNALLLNVRVPESGDNTLIGVTRRRFRENDYSTKMEAGKPFTISIFATDDYFYIGVNGQRLVRFINSALLSGINRVCVRGQISEAKVIIQPPAVYLYSMVGGLSKDQSVSVHGAIPYEATEFSIYLGDRYGNVALQIKVPMVENATSNGKGPVVLNASNIYDSRDNAHVNKFERTKKFFVNIVVTSGELRNYLDIHVNGELLAYFVTTMNLAAIDVAYAVGDVYIDAIERHGWMVREHEIPNGLSPNQLIVVNGFIQLSSSIFIVDIGNEAESTKLNIQFILKPDGEGQPGRIRIRLFRNESWVEDHTVTRNFFFSGPFILDVGMFPKTVATEAVETNMREQSETGANDPSKIMEPNLHEIKISLYGEHVESIEVNFLPTEFKKVRVEGDVEFYSID